MELRDAVQRNRAPATSCDCKPFLVAVMAIVLASKCPSIGVAQPIDPAMATGTYSGGGVTLKGADLRRIAAGESIEGRSPESEGGPRGGGAGNVLLVECNGAYGYSTIQGAIDDATDGDVVVVLPNDCEPDGRWHENIDFLGKAIRVQSANPADDAIVEATVIDGSAAGTVVTFASGEGADSVLDGLTITNGLGIGAHGGGITSDDSAPIIRRSVMIQNHAVYGGALLSQGTVAPTFVDCRFDGNSATLRGQAISIGGYATWPTLIDCELMNHGGAELYYGHAGGPADCGTTEPCAQAIGCVFHDNTSSVLLRGDGLTVSDCIFANNTGECIYGGGMTVRGCRFEGNHGAFLFYNAAFAQIEDSAFINNEGCFFVLQVHSTMRNCLFEGNQNSGSLLQIGPLIHMSACRFIRNTCGNSVVLSEALYQSSIEQCDFLDNQGTALWITHDFDDPSRLGPIRRCTFTGNTSQLNGAAIRMYNGRVEECSFAGNTTSGDGGAIYGVGAVVDGCTVVGNRANIAGGVTGATISNSIVWNNRDSYGNGHQSQVSQATTATFSDIQNLQYDFTPGGISNALAGNISLDPRFVDPGHWDDMGTPEDLSDDVFVVGDYHLLADSPCIDGGDPAFVAAPDTVDIDDEPRVMSCRVDMGVDEFTQEDVGVPGDFDGDGVVTVDDVPAFLAVTLEPLGLGVCRADLNGDGLADGRDVSAMAALLLGS